MLMEMINRQVDELISVYCYCSQAFQFGFYHSTAYSTAGFWHCLVAELLIILLLTSNKNWLDMLLHATLREIGSMFDGITQHTSYSFIKKHHNIVSVNSEYHNR